ncbi:MAG: hypothetical protein KDA43_13225 [Hyphomonas sp.]|nr:hypothetical protein [Hyphomonas sp.]MCB9960934.1 hypothetical protein [Hyphomonas sp.]
MARLFDIILFGGGVLLVIYSNWHLDKRRNEAGVEEYSGFFDMLTHRAAAVGMGLLGFVIAMGGVIAFALSLIPR